MATPRNLDPKFKDADVPADAKDDDTPVTETKADDAKVDASVDESKDEFLARVHSTEIPKDPNEGNIVHRTQYTDENGVAKEKVHGPMPVSEWADYSKEKGL